MVASSADARPVRTIVMEEECISQSMSQVETASEGMTSEEEHTSEIISQAETASESMTQVKSVKAVARQEEYIGEDMLVKGPAVAVTKQDRQVSGSGSQAKASDAKRDRSQAKASDTKRAISSARGFARFGVDGA